MSSRLGFVPLGDLVTIHGGGTPQRSNPDFYSGGIPWVTPKDMKSWEISSSRITITEAGLKQSATRLVPSSSVLIVVRSGILKHSLPVAITRQPVALNQDMKALICNGKLSPEYLARFLQASAPIILRWVRATTADNFPIDKLRGFPIPLPPLEEQRRIAAILDAADSLRAKRRAALAKLDQLAQSIFVDMFGDRIAKCEGWARVLVRDISEIIVPTRDKPKAFDGSIPWVTLPDLRGLYVQRSKNHLTHEAAAQVSNRLIPKGAVLLSCAGSLGKVAIASVDLYANQQFYGLVPVKAKVNSHFLAFALRQKGEHFFKSISGTVTIGFFSKNKALDIDLVLPPLNLQDTFKRRLMCIDQIRAINQSARDKIEALFSSLQHRAFRDDL